MYRNCRNCKYCETDDGSETGFPAIVYYCVKKWRSSAISDTDSWGCERCGGYEVIKGKAFSVYEADGSMPF